VQAPTRAPLCLPSRCPRARPTRASDPTPRAGLVTKIAGRARKRLVPRVYPTDGRPPFPVLLVDLVVAAELALDPHRLADPAAVPDRFGVPGFAPVGVAALAGEVAGPA